MRKSISIIIPYFGQVPRNYDSFLSSISYDLPFNIHIVSDLKFPLDSFGKITLHESSFDALRRKFVSILGRNICLDRPYKLCDFRPLYGILFPEIVGGSDYWGWGDLDVVFGRVGHWIAPHIENSVDVISFKKLWLSGSLSILKNRGELIEAYKDIPKWESFLTSNGYHGFDECLRRWELHSSIGNLDDVSMQPKCLTRHLWGEHKSGRLSVVMTDSAKEWIAPNEVIAYSRKDGSVRSRMSEEEFAYYHSVCENGRTDFFKATSELVKGDFLITREGFWDCERKITRLGRGIRKLYGLSKRVYGAALRELRSK